MRSYIIASNMKLRRSRALKVACIVLFVLNIIGNLLFKGVLSILTGDIIEKAGGFESDLEAFDNISMLDCAAISLSLMQVLSLTLAIIITLHISYERKCGIDSFILARGFSKESLYAGKIYEISVISLVLYISYVLGAVISGAVLWHGDITGEMILGFVKMFIIMAIMYLAVSYLFMAIAININNGGIAITLNIIVAIVISAVVTAIDKNINGDEAAVRCYYIFTAIEQYAYLEITIKEIFTSIANAIVYGGMAILIGSNIYKKS